MNLAAGRRGVVRLEVGEPLFSTPPHIVEAAVRAVRDGLTRYTPNAGLPSVREAVCARMHRDYGLEIAPERVCVTVGGVGGISSALRAAVDAGDEVLIPDPGWPNYYMMAVVAGAVPRRYPLRPENGYLPDLDELRSMVGPRTRVLVVNSPSNPLGTVFPPALVEALVDFVSTHDLILISDEVYDRIIYEGTHRTACAYDPDGRVVAVFSASKTYAMTGWRVGYAIAGEEMVRQMAKLQEAYVSCAPAPSQKALEAALTGPQDGVEAMCRTYRENRDLTCRLLAERGIPHRRPEGAFYVWIEAGCRNSTEFAHRLLTERGVALAPGSTFGPRGEGYVRVSLVSAAEAIREGVAALAAAIAGAAVPGRGRPDGCPGRCGA
ncbi:MAG TPA: aminotransferase class I/II [Clostridiales bacterium]|nr:aminotransferase class I/II [Clostridiales bacterium]